MKKITQYLATICVVAFSSSVLSASEMYTRNWEKYPYDSVLHVQAGDTIKKVEYSFKSSNNEYLEKTYLYDKDSKSWSLDLVESRIYDRYTLGHELITYNKGLYNANEIASRTVRRFDRNDSLSLEEVFLYVPASKTYVESTKLECEYSDDGQPLLKERYTWNASIGVYVLTEKEEYEYSENGYLTLFNLYSASGSSDLVLEQATKYEFVQNSGEGVGKETITQYSKDAGWHARTLKTYFYNTDGTVAEQIDSVSDGDIEVLNVGLKRKYTNSSGRVSVEVRSEFKNGYWSMIGATYFSYRNGLPYETRVLTHKNGGTVVSEEKLKFKYKNDGLLCYSKRSHWDKENAPDVEVIDSETNYYYPIVVEKSELSGNRLTLTLNATIPYVADAGSAVPYFSVASITGGKSLEITNVKASQGEEVVVTFDRAPKKGESYTIATSGGVVVDENRQLVFKHNFGDASSLLVSLDYLKVFDMSEMDYFTSKSIHGADSILFFTEDDLLYDRYTYSENDIEGTNDCKHYLIKSESVTSESSENDTLLQTETVSSEEYRSHTVFTIDSVNRSVTEELYYIYKDPNVVMERIVTDYNEDWQPVKKTTHKRPFDNVSNEAGFSTYVVEYEYGLSGQLVREMSRNLSDGDVDVNVFVTKYIHNIYGELVEVQANNTYCPPYEEECPEVVTAERYDRTYKTIDGKVYPLRVIHFYNLNDEYFSEASSSTYVYEGDKVVAQYDSVSHFSSGFYHDFWDDNEITYKYDSENRPIEKIDGEYSPDEWPVSFSDEKWTVRYTGDIVSSKKYVESETPVNDENGKLFTYDEQGRLHRITDLIERNSVLVEGTYKQFYYPITIEKYFIENGTDISITFSEPLENASNVMEYIKTNADVTVSELINDAYIAEEDPTTLVIELVESPNNGEAFTLYMEEGVESSNGIKAQFEIELGNTTEETATDVLNKTNTEISVYPTISNSDVTIVASDALSTISLVNAEGDAEQIDVAGFETYTIDVSSKPAGLYILQVRTQNENQFTYRLVVQE